MIGLARSASASAADRLNTWREVLMTMNLPEDKPVDAVSKWLIMTRAAVIPMTLFSGLIGGLLATQAQNSNWLYFLVCVTGLVVAHACNNLINDYFDLEGGIDTAEAPRALYAPHPVLSGWITRPGLMRTIIALNVFDAAIMGFLFFARGWPAAAFAASGFLISVFYVAPPLRLKHHGLGEPAVFIVWGPLMVCGTYYITTGELPGWVWAASIPYAILVTSVLIGKHIDKLPYDAAHRVRTLPVILGERAALRLNQILMGSFYAVVVVLYVFEVLPVWTLVVAAAVPMLWRTVELYSKPKPAAPPPDYPIWPLWYVAAAFVHARRAGALLVLGLLVGWIAS
jgi:1,4-dihydroxy-2-naphthoate polyprenyltransferase